MYFIFHKFLFVVVKKVIFRSQSCTLSFFNAYEPDHEKTCLILYANNKGADQPAHPRILISTFVVRCLTVGANDGPLLRFYLKSASAVWDYILSQNSIKKILSTSCDFGLFVYKIYQWTVASNYRAANFNFENRQQN